MGEIEDRRWKVGELAKATGLTVRALHHYDDVGLLVPRDRTSAGHRLYADQDVRRLYHVLALFAFREEVTRRPSRIGSEHILLGLMHANQEALVDFGVEADRVREAMHRAMALTADESSTGEV